MNAENNVPQAQPRGWRRPSLVGPIILILIGALFLASNLGVLHVAWWELWRLWPVVLVLVGLDLLSRHSRWASAIVGLATVALVGGVVYVLVAQPGLLNRYFGPTGANATYTVSQELGGARVVDVDVRMGVGTLRLGALEDSARLVEGSLDYPERNGNAPYVSYVVSGDRGRLRVESRTADNWVGPFGSNSRGEEWTMRFSPRVALNLNVNTGASNSTLDLTQLLVSDLRINGGVGRLEVLFPVESDTMTARIDGGVGEVVLDIPEEQAVRIHVNGGLGSTNIASRFKGLGDDNYETENYSSASKRLDIYVDGGVGSLRVE